MSYNGWTNYETWNVALWIDKEEGTHNLRHQWVEECVEQEYNMRMSDRLPLTEEDSQSVD